MRENRRIATLSCRGGQEWSPGLRPTNRWSPLALRRRHAPRIPWNAARWAAFCSLVIGVRIGIIALLRLSVYSVSGADSLGVVRGLDGSSSSINFSATAGSTGSALDT